MILVCVIFAAEVCVVTIGTLRIIFVSRGNTLLAPTLGFFEVTTWLFAISQTMQNLDRPACFLAFALGFTLGNFLGILIEKKLALGTLKVHVITHRESDSLLQDLRGAEFGATRIAGQGATGPVDVIMTVVRRKQLGRVLAIIRDFDPDAFFAVDELQITSAGIFPLSSGKAAREEPYDWRPVQQFDAREMVVASAEK